MSKAPNVAIKILPHGEDLPLPDYQTADSAGMDLRAAIEGSVVFRPGERHLLPTGLCMALPHGYEGQVRPRSGLAFKHGMTIVNTPGTVDADYRGEVSVVMVNLGQEPYTVERGDRIAQLVVAPVSQAVLNEVEELPESGRGAGGYGSTGRS